MASKSRLWFVGVVLALLLSGCMPDRAPGTLGVNGIDALTGNISQLKANTGNITELTSVNSTTIKVIAKAAIVETANLTTLNVSGNTTVNGDILPSTDNTSVLGDNVTAWKNVQTRAINGHPIDLSGNLTGPPGEKGDKGDTGDKGDKGDTGNVGGTGASGANGASGVIVVNSPIVNSGNSTSANLSLAYQPADNATLMSHIGDTSNPHSVTKAQVGLGSVDNTADTAKPVSTAQQAALDLKATLPIATANVTGLDTALSGKQATLVSGTNIKTVNSNSLVGSGDIVITAVSDGSKVDKTTTVNGQALSGNVTLTAANVSAEPAISGGLVSQFWSGIKTWVTIVISANESGSANQFLTAYNNLTGAWTKARPTWADIDKTTSDIANITTRSHTSLTDIGTNTHAAIDTFIASKGAASGLATLDASGNLTANLSSINQIKGGTANQTILSVSGQGSWVTLLETHITNLVTDLAGKVATTLKINGFPLTGDVTLTASNITTGTIPSGVTYNGAVITGTYGGTGINNGSNTLNVSTINGTLAITNGKTLNVTDTITTDTNKITFANGAVLQTGTSKNVTFTDAFKTEGAFQTTLVATGTTNVTLPTSGTLSTTVGTVTSVTGTAPITSTQGATPAIGITGGTLISRTVLTSTASTNFLTNASTTKILVQLVGAGGGGGGATGTSTLSAVGGGGGSGGYAEKIFTVVGTTNYTYQCGAGGLAGGAVAGNVGGTGSTTNFTVSGTTVSAFGGVGGVASASGSTDLSALGGAGGSVSTNGDFNTTGSAGGWGLRMTGSLDISGQGAGSIWGGGAASINTAGNGVNGTAYGGGGSGAMSISTAARTGGVGGQGAIIVWEFTK